MKRWRDGLGLVWGGFRASAEGMLMLCITLFDSCLIYFFFFFFSPTLSFLSTFLFMRDE